jgi:hypothetical protein
MIIIAGIISFFLSIFSTIVLSYISMATGIGPWIAPTLVLIAMPLFKLLVRDERLTERVGLVTAAGSVGGILATGMGFSLPTLYFVDPDLFNSWMASPAYFVAMLGLLAFAAGAFGLLIANILEQRFVYQENLSFPVGQLVYKMIAVQDHAKKAWDLLIGFVATAVFCILQDGIFAFKGFLPKAITLMPKINLRIFHIPAIRLDIWPLVFAIGFVTGHMIAIPLAVGAFSKICIVDPINTVFFASMPNFEFILSFCSGMVVSGTLASFLDAPKLLYKTIKKLLSGGTQQFRVNGTGLSQRHVIELAVVVTGLIAYLWVLGFSVWAQAYVLIFTAMCTYEIAMQAGKMGLARLGSFATFVMLPAMFLFDLSVVNIVLIAAFVEICGGVAADILFGRKLAKEAGISSSTMELYQWFGLLISSLAVGIIFWLLISRFTLGSPELFALKAQNRQLLIEASNFNVYVMALGFLFGFLLKELKVAPSLVLGGILMPLNISLGLITGGLMTLFTKNKEAWYPLWSGVFAANSLWMLIKAII